MLPMPPPNARSTVPGRRISARVAERASERGSSPSGPLLGHLAAELLERQATLLGRQPLERLLVRQLDPLRRRRAPSAASAWAGGSDELGGGDFGGGGGF